MTKNKEIDISVYLKQSKGLPLCQGYILPIHFKKSISENEWFGLSEPIFDNNFIDGLRYIMKSDLFIAEYSRERIIDVPFVKMTEFHLNDDFSTFNCRENIITDNNGFLFYHSFSDSMIINNCKNYADLLFPPSIKETAFAGEDFYTDKNNYDKYEIMKYLVLP